MIGNNRAANDGETPVSGHLFPDTVPFIHRTGSTCLWFHAHGIWVLWLFWTVSTVRNSTSLTTVEPKFSKHQYSASSENAKFDSNR